MDRQSFDLGHSLEGPDPALHDYQGQGLDNLYSNPPFTIHTQRDPKGELVKSCRIHGSVIAETRNNLILHPENGSLLGELRVEHGNLCRTVIQLYDGSGTVRFVFRKRRLHREVQVYLQGGDPSSSCHDDPILKKWKPTMRALTHGKAATGQRLHVLSCYPTRPGGPEDWLARPPGGSPWALHRKGPELFWGGSLKGLELEVIFAFAHTVDVLWAQF